MAGVFRRSVVLLMAVPSAVLTGCFAAGSGGPGRGMPRTPEARAEMLAAIRAYKPMEKEALDGELARYPIQPQGAEVVRMGGALLYSLALTTLRVVEAGKSNLADGDTTAVAGQGYTTALDALRNADDMTRGLSSEPGTRLLRAAVFRTKAHTLLALGNEDEALREWARAKEME